MMQAGPSTSVASGAIPHRHLDHQPREQQASPSPLATPIFMANHHRLHNPDDPALLANPSRSKRASIFGGMLRGNKAKETPRSKSGSSTPRAAPTKPTAASTASPSTPNGSSSIYRRPESNRSTPSLSTRSRSNTRRQSLGPNSDNSGLSQAVSRALVHDKVTSNDSRPPSEHVRDSSGAREVISPLDSPIAGTTEHDVAIRSSAEGESMHPVSVPGFAAPALLSDPAPGSSHNVVTGDSDPVEPASSAFGHALTTNLRPPTISQRTKSLSKSSSRNNVTELDSLDNSTQASSDAMTSQNVVEPDSSITASASFASDNEANSSTHVPCGCSDPVSSQSNPARVRPRLEPRDPVVSSLSILNDFISSSGRDRRRTNLHNASGQVNHGDGDQGDDDQDDDFDDITGGARRRDMRTMNMIDFLNSEPPPPEPVPVTQPASSSRRLKKRSFVPTSAPASTPLLSALSNDPSARNALSASTSASASLTPSPSASRRGSGLSPDRLPISLTRSRSQERSNKAKADSTSAAAKTAAVTLKEKPKPMDLASQLELSVEPLAEDIFMFGSTQTSSNYSLSGSVVLTIPRCKPQSMPSAHSAPQAAPKDVGRRGSMYEPPSPSKAKIPIHSHRHTSSLANPGVDVSGESGEQETISIFDALSHESLPHSVTSPSATTGHGTHADPDEAVSFERPSFKVESLTVTFSGYALYVDHSGRYNAIKLATASQDLLPTDGCVCYADGHDVDSSEGSTETGGPHQLPTTQAGPKEPVKYEIEFDLAVPGWLPGSLRTRFGGTFYCLQAMAIVDGRSTIVASASGGDLSALEGLPIPNGTASLEPLRIPSRTPATGGSSFREPDRLSTSPTEMSTPTQLASPPSAPQPGSVFGASQGTPGSTSASSSGATTRSKGGSWLGKKAKQLQLKTSKKSSRGSGNAEEGGSSALDPAAADAKSSGKDNSSSLKADWPSTDQRTSAENRALPNGKRKVRSAAVAIVIRRCRDVVPVPVARMALLDRDRDLEALRDPPPMPSLTTSASLTQSGSNANLRATLVQSGSLDRIADPAPPRTFPSSMSMPSLTVPSPPPSSASTTSGSAAVSVPPTIQEAPPASTSQSTTGGSPAAAAQAPQRSSSSGMLPPAPSAFDLPSDPAKQAAAVSSMSASATQSSLNPVMRRNLSTEFGNTHSPPRTSSRPATSGSRSSAPMRHFLHRPVLYPPPELGIFGKSSGLEGLPFSLTLSIPSHVQVAGPKSDTLTFGVQIEVGKSEGWNAVRKLGGLRLKDMELVCLQTERHSSMPSRTFCAAFPVPPSPNNVQPGDLPFIAPGSKKASSEATLSGAELHLRQGYDRDLVAYHMTLLESGTAPDPVNNNVERTRTTVVGPPPPIRATPGPNASGGGPGGKGIGKGKEKEKSNRGKDKKGKPPSAPTSGTSTPDLSGRSGLRGAFAPSAQLGQGTQSVLQPRPRSAVRPMSSNSSLRNASGTATPVAVVGSSSVPGEGSGSGTASRSRTLDLASELSTVSSASGSGGASGTGSGNGGGGGEASGNASASSRAEASSSTASTSAAAGSPQAPKPVSRRRRVYANAMNRLSTLATSMLEAAADEYGPHGEESPVASGRAGENGFPDDMSSRATYVFSGDDGEGVDLTRGRVRMTINLPLVSSDGSVARSKGSAQLLSDFESPYVRIRHKLKVKLGFGLDTKTDDVEQSWAQALVMCVPVRFTESPPKEVQDQLAPMMVRPVGSRATAALESGNSGARGLSSWATSDGTAVVPVTVEGEQDQSSGLPLLPAYTQLFREDGSRLADEGEDLPQYPGRMSVIGEIEDSDEGQNEISADTNRDGSTRAGANQESETLNASEQEDEYRAQDMVSHGEASEDSGGNKSQSLGGAQQQEGMQGLGAGAGGPAVMDRSTSLPGHRNMMRGAGSIPMLKSSTSSSVLQQRAAGHDPFASASRPAMRQRSATSASLGQVAFSRIAPAEVVDEALMLNMMEDDEARRDADRADADEFELDAEQTQQSTSSEDSEEDDEGEEDAEDEDEDEDEEEDEEREQEQGQGQGLGQEQRRGA